MLEVNINQRHLRLGRNITIPVRDIESVIDVPYPDDFIDAVCIHVRGREKLHKLGMSSKGGPVRVEMFMHPEGKRLKKDIDKALSDYREGVIYICKGILFVNGDKIGTFSRVKSVSVSRESAIDGADETTLAIYMTNGYYHIYNTLKPAIAMAWKEKIDKCLKAHERGAGIT